MVMKSRQRGSCLKPAPDGAQRHHATPRKKMGRSFRISFRVVLDLRVDCDFVFRFFGWCPRCRTVGRCRKPAIKCARHRRFRAKSLWEGDAVNLPEFKKELQKRIQEEKREWPESECSRLAQHIASELERRLGSALTPVLSSNIVVSIPSSLQRTPSPADVPSLEVTRQYYRWAIADLAKRPPLTKQQEEQLLAEVTRCLSALRDHIQQGGPSNLLNRDLLDRCYEGAAQFAIRNIRDPLCPGLKRSIQKEALDEIYKKQLASWKREEPLIARIAQIASKAPQPQAAAKYGGVTPSEGIERLTRSPFLSLVTEVNH